MCTLHTYVYPHIRLSMSIVLCNLLLYEQLNQLLLFYFVVSSIDMFYYRISRPNYIQLCECSELFLSKKLARGSWLTTYLGLFSSISFSSTTFSIYVCFCLWASCAKRNSVETEFLQFIQGAIWVFFFFLTSCAFFFFPRLRNATLQHISKRIPRTKEELLEINGIGK